MHFYNDSNIFTSSQKYSNLESYRGLCWNDKIQEDKMTMISRRWRKCTNDYETRRENMKPREREWERERERERENISVCEKIIKEKISANSKRRE